MDPHEKIFLPPSARLVSFDEQTSHHTISMSNNEECNASRVKTLIFFLILIFWRNRKKKSCSNISFYNVKRLEKYFSNLIKKIKKRTLYKFLRGEKWKNDFFLFPQQSCFWKTSFGWSSTFSTLQKQFGKVCSPMFSNPVTFFFFG